MSFNKSINLLADMFIAFFIVLTGVYLIPQISETTNEFTTTLYALSILFVVVRVVYNNILFGKELGGKNDD